MRINSLQTALVYSVIAFFGLTHVALSQPNTKLALDPKRAFSYLKKICDIGPRVTGTAGMEEQQNLLEQHFKKLGAKVTWQEFNIRHPEMGGNVVVKNLIVTWNPDETERVLLSTHYDTRPYPDKDLRNPKGIFIGANDGASGTALFMEMGHVLQKMPMKVGVDLVFFDAEEIVFDAQRDPLFVGSTHFAQAYVNDPTTPRYRSGILIDMIADSDLQLFYEQNSLKYAKPLVEEVWGIAKELKISAFKPSVGYEITDDHLPLNSIAKIPVIDLIDFDYTRGAKGKSFWHTTGDTPEQCSGTSMTKIGSVLIEWIKRQK
ncbi:MAG: M28 family peptidase [Planctomycetota bacterium]|nr:M28 family peptidase [Planctomycetota bacterium]